ncbi:MAG: peptide-methionine (S)-S-oxide reductase [Parcubacteria group bacterium CG10_big_fil_rev_8_21_14_0_10_41_35]|nr:MAG: peptide-methionine (S)-S-oxide reductase [Parcubacteria group bacterium CG10_big_fil_rev_8_21_14_0_10_41_35]
MNTQTIILGSGCFWCSEAVFQKLRGIVSVTPGYFGGTQESPTYEQVCSGNTGHAEVVKIEFNLDEISLEDILSVFFGTHDPTTKNRQGSDIGTQYRSVIYYTSDGQKQAIERFINSLAEQKLFSTPVVTEAQKAGTFWEAEEYHKNYFVRNPDKAYCSAIINPKLKKLHEKFASLIKT